MPTPKGYRHKKLGSARACAAGSFRRVRSGKALVTVCCPRGRWARKRCKVGMKAIGLDVRLGSLLDRMAAKELREHPWAGRRVARRIARDHLRKGKRR